MRKRNIAVITRLNKQEQQHLKNLVKKSGLSQEAYIRHLINGVVPVESFVKRLFLILEVYHLKRKNQTKSLS